VRAAWWHEHQDEVMHGFLVEPQNQGRAGTTWEPSPEWRLAEATPSSRGFQWFTRKPLGSLVDPQSSRPVGTGLTGEVHRPDRCAMSQGAGSFEAEDTRRDRKACIEATRSAVAGHPSDGAMTKISDFALEGHVSLIS
jgi:hypothetical protein